MHFHYIAGGDCCSRASGYLIFLILHTWNTFISGFRTVNSVEDHRPSLLVIITCWLDIRLQNPAPCKLFLGWATKFSRISASRGLEIQVFLAEWLVTLFPSSWSPAFFERLSYLIFTEGCLPHLRADYGGPPSKTVTLAYSGISTGRWLRDFLSKLPE